MLIGATGMVGDQQRSLWRVLKVWWLTKNVSPHTLIMKNYGVAGMSFLRLNNNINMKISVK